MTRIGRPALLLALSVAPLEAQLLGNLARIEVSGSIGVQRGMGGDGFETRSSPTVELLLSVTQLGEKPRRELSVSFSQNGVECLNIVPCGTFPAFGAVGLLFGARSEISSRVDARLMAGPAYYSSQNDASTGFGKSRWGVVLRAELGIQVGRRLRMVVAPRLDGFPPIGKDQLGAMSLGLGLRY